MKTIELLVKFVNQKPGLDFCNYGDVRAFRQEMNEITRDKHDFNELLSFAFRRIDDLEKRVTDRLITSNGRLTLKDGKLEYITGQYFCVEYRPAAASVLSNIIWRDYADERDANGKEIYKTGDEIRKALRRNFSRRVMKNYFN